MTCLNMLIMDGLSDSVVSSHIGDASTKLNKIDYSYE